MESFVPKSVPLEKLGLMPASTDWLDGFFDIATLASYRSFMSSLFLDARVPHYNDNMESDSVNINHLPSSRQLSTSSCFLNILSGMKEVSFAKDTRKVDKDVVRGCVDTL